MLQDWKPLVTTIAAVGGDFPEEAIPELSFAEYVSQVKGWGGVARQKEPSVQEQGRQESTQLSHCNRIEESCGFILILTQFFGALFFSHSWCH